MKKIWILLSLWCCCTITTAFSLKSEKVYVATFLPPSPELEKLGEAVAIDFETTLLTCKKRFKVYERQYYTSWLPEDKTAKNTLKQELLPENLDYLVFGAIVHDGMEDRYVIEYGFEEVNTSKILIIDKMVFDSKTDLLDADTRLNEISNRIIDKFALCVREHKSKEKKPKKPKKKKVAPDKPKAVAQTKQKAKVPSKSSNPVATGTVEIKERVQYRFRDRDKDGVPDLIDLEKDSPIGAIVNARGITIPDEVKEMMINKPAPQRTDTTNKEMDEALASILAEKVPALPTISFTFNTAKVEEEAYAQLHHVAMVMRMYPAIRVVITGNVRDVNKGMAYQRALNTIEYLINNYDIADRRFALHYDALMEEKPHTVKIAVMTKNVGSMPEPAE